MAGLTEINRQHNTVDGILMVFFSPRHRHDKVSHQVSGWSWKSIACFFSSDLSHNENAKICTGYKFRVAMVAPSTIGQCFILRWHPVLKSFNCWLLSDAKKMGNEAFTTL
nr:hypothetical protein [Escherichia coli]